MSFSGDVRNELAKQIGTARHCQIAYLSAILFFEEEGETSFCFETEHVPTAETVFLLLKKLFQITPEMKIEKRSKTKRMRLEVQDPAQVQRIRQTCGFSEGASHMRPADSPILQKDCCRRAFLKGAFLTAGSMNDPKRAYHMEFICKYREQAEQLGELLKLFGIVPGIIQRKKYFVVYVKESESIANLLGLMGCRVNLMAFENARILKEMREHVNRTVNCEAANINKTVNAAVRQIEDIRLIEEKIGLEHLPNRLDEIARVRLQYPETALRELGEMLEPPIGKSGVNHRLRKLSSIAETLRK